VIQSPCNRICVIDPASALCRGCGRSLAEIARWSEMSDHERERVMADLDRRMQSVRPAAV
jgi:hypothetical protein